MITGVKKRVGEPGLPRGFGRDVGAAFEGEPVADADLEFVDPVSDGVGVEGDGGGELGEGGVAGAGFVEDKVAEELGAGEVLGSGVAGGALEAVVGCDDQEAAGGRPGVGAQDPLDEGVGIAAGAGVPNFGVADGYALFAGAEGGGLVGGRATAIADQAEGLAGVAAEGDEVDQAGDFNPGEAGREDAPGVENVVGIEEEHGGTGDREGKRGGRDR